MEYDKLVVCHCKECWYREWIWCTHDMNEITPNTKECKFHEDKDESRTSRKIYRG